MSERPNILWIMTDQHSFDCVGYAADSNLETPNIDRLAREGCVFENTYTPCPVCGPARGAVFTGMFPPNCGVVSNWVPFRGDVPLLPERLREAGYHTATVGKLHFVPHMKQWGFEHKKLHDATYNFYSRSADFSDYVQWLQEEKYQDDPGKPIRLAEADEMSRGEDKYRFLMGSNWNDEEHHETTWVANESIDYLEDYESENPFFLFTSFFGPHQPFMPPEPWDTTYTAEDVELPPQLHAEMDNCPIYNARGRGQREKHLEKFDEQQFRELIAGYYSNIAMIDHYIGNICDTLMEEGMWDDTMIIFTADHGDHMSKYGMFGKAQMYDSCCRVPLVIKPPAEASGYPDRVEDVVNTLDCYGTCLDAAGDENWEYDPMEAEGIECESLWPFLQGEQPDRDNRTFSIIGKSADDCLCMCREGPLKLVRLARGEEEPLYEMYDLEKNPLETENIYNDPDYREDRDRLQKMLDEWWEEQKQNYNRDEVKFGWRKREDSPYK